MKKILVILPVALLLLSCSKTGPGSSEDCPVLFSLDTKSLGEGERTIRAALFAPGYSFVAQGTYCNDVIHHESTLGPNGKWLSPCRVDNDGLPLKSDGTEAVGLSQADKDSKYGLRRETNGNFYLVAASPAKSISEDGFLRYYPWTAATATNLYVSDPILTNLQGTWLDGEYVYTSSREALKLKNRSANIKVHIECGAQSYADIQSVTLLNLVTAARWYMTTGFSAMPDHYTATPTTTLYDCAGTPMHIVKNDPVPANSSWTSSGVYLPSIDYSDNTYSAMRPVIEVRMGVDTEHPAIARVTVSEKVEPMKNYTYNLYVSKSEVIISLSVSGWDDGGTISSVDNEVPGLIGTVTVDGWSGGETNAADPPLESSPF